MASTSRRWLDSSFARASASALFSCAEVAFSLAASFFAFFASCF
jgi:hypothetical protein